MRSLRAVSDRPEVMDDLTVPELAALIAAASAKVMEKARAESQVAPLLGLEQAAPLLGMNPDTLRKRAKTDPAIRALTVDNGTSRVVFDPGKIVKFRERRAG